MWVLFDGIRVFLFVWDFLWGLVMLNFFDIMDLDDELDYEVCIGSYWGDIVGICYYCGMVNYNEMVLLICELYNLYDRNVVCVDNVCGI